MKKTKIAIGADHAGFELKEYLKEYLKSKDFEVIDFGCDSTESVDYPDYAIPVAEYLLEEVTEDLAELIRSGVPFEELEIDPDFHHFPSEDNSKGILICGSGSGMCMTANKVEDIRAVNCYNKEIASLAVRHNDANVLCLGARFVSKELAKEIVDTFLNEKFEMGRHFDRVMKVHCQTGI